MRIITATANTTQHVVSQWILKREGFLVWWGQMKMTIMNYTRLSSITGSSLRDLLGEGEQSGCIVIDCRPFVAYNDGHIKNAVNICCPSLLRRRLKKPSANLETLVSCQTTLKCLRDSQVKTIVLYDEGTSTITSSENEASQASSSLAVVGRLLANELKKKTCYLKGGFLDFKLKYPTMCEWPQRQQTRPSPLRGPATLHLDFNQRNGERNDPTEDADTAPVEILPFLYLGNESHCACKEVLDKLGVTAVMNVSKTISNHFQDQFIYKNVPVDDTYNADISRWFGVAVDFIDSVEKSGGKVLIHCQAGISRSATICLAYLMSKCKYSLEEAYEYVKERRSVISPNFNFMGQLLSWEREVNSVLSPDKLSPAHSPCGLFNYSTMSVSSDTRSNNLHSNNCFVTVQTPT